MRQAEFLNQLRRLVDTEVDGLTGDEKIAIIRKLCDKCERLETIESLPECHIVPFVMGRRPSYEAAHPGLGSSHNLSLILDESEHDALANHAHILFYLTDFSRYSEAELDRFSLDLSLYFSGPGGRLRTEPLPGWDRRPIAPHAWKSADAASPQLEQVRLGDSLARRLVATFSPNRDFLPGPEWQWENLDAQIRRAATDDQDPFTFGSLFAQQVYVEIRLSDGDLPISTAGTWLEVCDARRLGSLYQRIINDLIKPDSERQAQASGLASIDSSYHPWHPVLMIGTEKAALYTSSIIDDVVHDAHILTDPLWLLRVGRFLELLTCLGIIEAVKEDVGDLLTPAEREAFETSDEFAEIRQRINPSAWREVWKLRRIAFPRFGTPKVGDVSITNLLNKKRAVLAFLETHHEDLKQAIAMSGEGERNAQETWHRVLRDAERAVLRKTEEAFPELTYLKPAMKEFVLWHRKGKATSASWVPDQISALLVDQDGLYAAACNQYRASMNEVAAWAKERGLMDYTGNECVPRDVSLLQALFDGRGAHIRRLQRTDGYAESPLESSKLPIETLSKTEEILELLAEVPIFQLLNDEERCKLAGEARVITLGPLERLLVQGREGTSLFVVADGSLEVLVRQADGHDLPVATVETGSVIGEMSLLTGEQRSATVRAVDGAEVVEIGKMQYEPIIRARPTLIDELAKLMEGRASANRRQSADYDASQTVEAIGRRIRNFILGS